MGPRGEDGIPGRVNIYYIFNKRITFFIVLLF